MLAWWFLGLRWRGRENLPKSGPFILASNHIAFIDPVGISMGVPRKVIFVAKSKYYSGKGIGGRLLGWFLSAIGQVPIDPQSASAANPSSAITPPAAMRSRFRFDVRRYESVTSEYMTGIITMNATPMVGTRQPNRVAV